MQLWEKENVELTTYIDQMSDDCRLNISSF